MTSWRSRAWEGVVFGAFSWVVAIGALVGIAAVMAFEAWKRRRS